MFNVIWDLFWMVVSAYMIKLELKEISDNLYTANKAVLIKAILMTCVFVILTAKMCIISVLNIGLLLL